MSLPKKKPVKVFAAGCFNRIHEAHLAMLRVARTLGDEFVLVISHDAHNRKPNALPAETRRRRLESLGLADRVIVGRPDSFAQSLRAEKPDILVLGYDQRLPDEATEKLVRELGVEVVKMPWFPGKDRTCPLS